MVTENSKREKHIMFVDEIGFLPSNSMRKQNEKNKYKIKKDLYSNICIIPMKES